jgi:formylglycine-generating enzyme required for sulfatase activity
MITAGAAIDRDHAVRWYRRNRARTATLFALLADDAYYAQPIDLRHPIVFYEGHLPAFSLNTLVKKALGRPGVDAQLERLFARGIDPERAGASGGGGWPDRATVRAFVEAADALVVDALQHADLDIPGHPLLDRAEAVFAILEHEAMHQETLLYMWHRLPHAQKRRPAGYHVAIDGSGRQANEWIDVGAGVAQMGATRGAIPFGWDNEFGSITEQIAEFRMQRLNVTNADYLAFLDAIGAPENLVPAFWERIDRQWFWRGMFEHVPLPPQWPVYVSHDAAAAYASWAGKRLATEAEFHRAAFGDAMDQPRPYPWGEAAPTPAHGVFDFSSWEPHPVGSHPEGRSFWGIDDLVGNGWEWTSTVFAPFPGFRAMASYPEYSVDFFDGAHYVMKGASPATARELLRPSFRNWFRARYPYVYASFRLVETG